MLRKTEQNHNYCIYCEIYSTQFSSDDPVCIEDVKDVDDILNMLISIPTENHMLLDLYIDVCDLENPVFQESYSMCGTQKIDDLSKFVLSVWDMCIVPRGYI